MKVVHLAPYFPPQRIGGVGEVVYHLHHALLCRGVESLVLTTGRPAGETSVARIFSGPSDFVLRSALQLDRVKGADIVHCHQGEALGLALNLRCRRVRAPVLATYHVNYGLMARSNRPFSPDGTSNISRGQFRLPDFAALAHRVMDRLMMSTADEVSFIAESPAREFLGNEKGRAAIIIYNGVPEPPQTPGVRQVSRVELLYVGTVSHRKRVSMLPYILRGVRGAMPGSRMRLVGIDLQEHPGLRQEFERYGVRDAVCDEGRKAAKEIPDFYRSAKVLVVPSAYEGLPMVIMEAMKCGLPCVATRVSGHPEIIDDGVNGLLVDTDEPDQFVKACVGLLQDDAGRFRMSKEARKTVDSRFTVERQAEAYLALYGKIISEHASRS